MTHRPTSFGPARRAWPALLLAAALCLPCWSCATAVGTLAGPVTGPVSMWSHTRGAPAWVKALLLPVAIPVGPLLGLVEGARADAGLLRHGAYGVYPSPPFEVVFDPTSTELDTRPPAGPPGR